jgi:DHA2 family multidrug resistance protein-like MFS transporter
MFPNAHQRSRAIAVWAMSLSAGGALGPLVGGLLLQRYWWGSVFLIAVPVMALLLAAAPVILSEHRDPSRRQLDLTSVVLAIVSVLGVIFGIKQLGQAAPPLPACLAIVVGMLAGYAFLRRQKQSSQPVLDVRLLRQPVLATALAANTLGFFLVLGITPQTDQQLQLVVGLDPLQTGLATVPMFVVFIGGALVSPRITSRLAPGSALTLGLLVAAIGLIILVGAGPGHDGMWPLIIGQVVLAAGLAPIFPMVTSLVLAAAPAERVGAASGLAETTTELGGALGIAVLGIVATAAYRSDLRDLPGQTSLHVSDDSIGAAMSEAHGLPEPLASAVITASQHSFTAGVHLAALIGAAVAVAMAAVSAWTLRSIRRDQ